MCSSKKVVSEYSRIRGLMSGRNLCKKRFSPDVRVSQLYQQLSGPRFGHVQLDNLGGHFTRCVIDAGFVPLGELNVGHS